MSRHTPGPWIYYNTGVVQNGSHVYTLTSLAKRPASAHAGVWIADVRAGEHGEHFGADEGQANANLIASAPDLLDACRQALEAIGSRPLPSDGFGDLERTLRAAIIRAAPGSVAKPKE